MTYMSIVDLDLVLSLAVVDVSLNDCHTWSDGMAHWDTELKLDDFKLGAAYALTESLWPKGSQGIVGLGPGP